MIKKSGYITIGKNAVVSGLANEHHEELLQNLTAGQLELIFDVNQANRSLPRAIKKKNEQLGTCLFCQEVLMTSKTSEMVSMEEKATAAVAAIQHLLDQTMVELLSMRTKLDEPKALIASLSRLLGEKYGGPAVVMPGIC